MKFNIGAKLIIGFSIIIGLTLLIIGFSITASRIANESIDIVKNLRVPIVQVTTEARSNLLKMMTDVRGHLVLNEDSYIESYRQNKQIFSTNLVDLEVLLTNIPNLEHIENISQLKTDFEEWLEIIERLFILHESPRENQPALRLAHLEIQPLYVSAIYNLDNIIEIQREYSQSEKDYTLLMEIIEIHTSFDKMIMSLRAFATTGDVTLKYAYALNEIKNDAILKKMIKKQELLNDKQRINFNQFITIRKQTISLAAQIHETIGGEKSFLSLYLFKTQALSKARRMLMVLDKMTADHQAQLQTELDQGRNRLSKVQVRIIFGGLVSLLIGIGLTLFFRKIIVKPIQHLTHTAEQIAGGRLDVTAQVTSEDEIGRLSGTINYMAKQLQKDSIQAKDALKESEARFKKMIEQSPLPMVITVENQEISFFNDKFTELFGYTLNDVSTLEEWWKIAYPDKAYREKVKQSWMDAVEEATANDKEIEMQEWEFTIKDGTKRSCEFYMVPFEEVGLIVINDVTERRKIEEQLLQAQKMESIGTLAGGIAHDFNNILFPIIGHTEMLLEDVPEGSPLRESLNEIFASAMRSKDLVQQILTFSRHEKHEAKLMRIDPIVKETLKMIRSTIPSTIKITHNIDNNCGIIKADPTHIHQLMMNLLTNAYHAMGDDIGELNVELKEIILNTSELLNSRMIPGSYSCITVSDTGVGMDDTTKTRMFEPFFTTKEQGKGTGMGLSVVHGIIETMKGGIQIFSKPGKGTEISVYLPIKKNAVKEQNIQLKETIQGGTEKILIVDDEENIIRMEEQMLQRLGYHITSCNDSIEALEVFSSEPEKFDLVITDFAMPKMPGDKFASKLLAIRPDIPIVLCTGFSEKMTPELTKAIGIKDILMKPISKKDIARTIRKVLDEKAFYPVT